MNNLILPATWISALIVVVSITAQLDSASTHFFGIADNKEQTISFSYPVKIEYIGVVEGERVAQQQVVMRVSKRELASKKAIVEDQIKEALSKRNEEISTTVAELKSLQSKKAAALAELDGKINRLQSRADLDLKVLSEISGTRHHAEVVHSSPLMAEIAALKEQRTHLGQSMQAQIDNLKEQLADTDHRPIDAQLSELNEIKAQLEQQETELVVKSLLGGRVGSILYKANEQVAPFDPILTVHSNTPGSVKGYIHEDVLNNVKVGQSVWVRPMSANGTAGVYKGQVQSLGNRIVEYPQRLLKNPLMHSWGREVVIDIPPDNRFLAGEKVEVFLDEPVPPYQAVVAWLSDTWSSALNHRETGNAPPPVNDDRLAKIGQFE